MAEDESYMVEDGIPVDGSVDHDSNKYPGLIASWEYDRVFQDSHRAYPLFRVVVSGKFQPGPAADPTETIDNWIAQLDTSCTNKWDITHEFEPEDPESSKIMFIMRYSRSPYLSILKSKMRVYKAAVELENLLLTKMLPLAVSRFKIKTRALLLKETFHGIFEQSSDSDEEYTQEWLNMSTMDRVYDWITTVVPTFVRCWMPDVKVEALEAFDAAQHHSINAKQSLLSSNESVLVMVPATGGLVSTVGRKAAITELRDSREEIRHPCKIQVVSTDENPFVDASQTLKYTELVDITSAFATTHVVYVRKKLLDAIDTGIGTSRVFCVFPSFDKFPGLLSEEGRGMAMGSLHCNPDRTDENGNLVGPPTVFKTSGIVQCPGEALVRTRADTCQPSGDLFKIRKSKCEEPYASLRSDPTCCVLHFGLQEGLASEMRIYGNRTMDRPQDYLPLLNDAYEWFEREYGTEGRISVSTHSTQQFGETYALFKHFMPNCSTLEAGAADADSIARAIELMRFATDHDLVYNTKLLIKVTVSTPIAHFFPVFEIFPKNTTEIRLRIGENVHTINTIVSLDRWVSAQERRQVDVVYSKTEDGGGSSETHWMLFERVWMTMVSKGYRRFGPTTTKRVVQMRRDHVQLTIDSAEHENSERQTHLRYVAGAQYSPRAMSRPHV